MEVPQEDVFDLIGKLQELKHKPPGDLAIRRQLSKAIQELSFVLETPLETSQRIFFSPLQISIAKVASDLGIFELLSRHGNFMGIDDLNLKANVEKRLLARIMRYLAATNMLEASSRMTYRATSATRTMSEPGFKAGINHHFDIQLPSWLALPSYLASTGYADPTNPCQTPFQLAHKTNLPAFQWGIGKAGVMHDFGMWMSARRTGQRSWLDVFPLEYLRKSDHTSEAVFFVDVGGGVGHQCIAVKARMNSQIGRIILQDLPEVIANAIPIEGVERIPLDFWTNEPVHNEVVMADVETQRPAAELDVVMMSSLAGRERNEADWTDIVGNAGLRIMDILAYDEMTGDSIIVVSPLED
ncbi:MAG: hypothetical protein Q9218_006094 [Villophora microphyllina]